MIPAAVSGSVSGLVGPPVRDGYNSGDGILIQTSDISDYLYFNIGTVRRQCYAYRWNEQKYHIHHNSLLWMKIFQLLQNLSPVPGIRAAPIDLLISNTTWGLGCRPWSRVSQYYVMQSISYKSALVNVPSCHRISRARIRLEIISRTVNITSTIKQVLRFFVSHTTMTLYQALRKDSKQHRNGMYLYQTQENTGI